MNNILELTHCSDTKLCAIKYIKSLTVGRRSKLKTMLKHNVICCQGIAELYNVNPEEFHTELKNIFTEEELYKNTNDKERVF